LRTLKLYTICLSKAVRANGGLKNRKFCDFVSSFCLCSLLRENLLGKSQRFWEGLACMSERRKYAYYQGLGGGAGSHERTRLRRVSLLNRENTGNFCKVGSKAAPSTSETLWFLGVFGRIPYSLEQGKFWT
jgi:hypothetical protein